MVRVLSRRRIAIVGGGAAGFAAAITAAREGCQVTIFESQDRVGNSIKVTGDGRCNIANSNTQAEDYRNADFVQRAFGVAGPDDALRFLEECGIMLREEAQGRLYPQANKSTSVIDALRLMASKLGVTEACGCAIRKVSRSNGRWAVEADGIQEKPFDAVVLACGGGEIPSGLLPKGVKANRPKPLLGPMATDTDPLKGLDKVRAKCSLRVGHHAEDGEATFRSYGVSGIAAFNLTRFANPGDSVFVDFLPQLGRDESLPLLERRVKTLGPSTWLDLTCGMLLPLVARAVLRQAGLDPDKRPEAASLDAFDAALRAFRLEYKGIGDKRLCQVRRGGVCVSQVDPETMQLAGAHEGLFVVGEMLDVDGPCGGYNLHWAWVSGMIAGKAVCVD